MKKIILVLALSFLSLLSVYAQENEIGTKMGIGFQLTQNQQDFGIGINLSSPYFAKEKIAFRLRGNLMWNQHLNSENKTIWSPYSNLSLGLIGISGEIGNFIRLYGEGGIVALFPSNNLSDDPYLIGGYGLFGFEFFMNRNDNYHIEIGGIGTGAVANKVIGNPIYSNGLLINVGYRHQF